MHWLLIDTLALGVIVITIQKAVVKAADLGGKSGELSELANVLTTQSYLPSFG